MKIAVLLTVYNRKKNTLRCLQHLFACKDLKKETIEVFLVDDASTDGTKEAVRNEFPQVNIIPGNGFYYWNGGMRLAWEYATNSNEYDFYIWLNDDTYLFEDSIRNILDDSTKLNHKAIVSGCTVSEISNKITYGGHRFDGKSAFNEGKLSKCDIINGNFVLIPKYVFKKVGFLDKKYPHAIGDHDYGLRASKCGINSYVASSIVGICESNTKSKPWYDSNINLKKRFKYLYSPLCPNHPRHIFRYRIRHFGLLHAMRDYTTIHLRTFFPGIK